MLSSFVLYVFIKEFSFFVIVVSAWTPAKSDSCIAGHHIKTFNNVANIGACGDLCDKEAPCKSVDYHPVTKACHFNNADTSTVKIHSPCQGYTFSEPGARNGELLK